MTDWIDFDALWRIVVYGLVFGAGLPALFGIGLKLLAAPVAATSVPASGSAALGAGDPGAPGSGRPVDGAGRREITSNRASLLAAGLCFAVVLAAIGAGIYLIVDGG